MLHFMKRMIAEDDEYLVESTDLLFLSMNWMRLFQKQKLKKLSLTTGLCLGYLLLLVTASCINSEDSDIFEGCPRPVEADAVGIKQVFFSPYRNQRYSFASDTVSFLEFGFNFELEIQVKEDQNSGSVPGQALPLSCIQTFNIGNISNISVILTEPFAGLPIGTDISFLLITPNNKLISDLKDFKNVSVYFGTELKITPANFSQLKTRTFLFFRNGTQTFFDSTSPILKTT